MGETSKAHQQQHEEALAAAKTTLSTSSLSLLQYEAEMADLIRARTEIECIIADFNQAGESGQKRRRDTAKELNSVEKRIGEVTGRLDALSDELDDRVKEEREAKET